MENHQGSTDNENEPANAFLALAPIHRPIIGLILLGLALLACRTTDQLFVDPTATATASPTSTVTPTITPVPTPTTTPTPQPADRNEAGRQALFYGDWETAFAEYQTVLESDTSAQDQRAALYGLGRTYYRSGDFPNALATLRDLVARAPEDPGQAPAYFTLGEIYTDLERYPEAVEAYSRYLEFGSGPIDYYVYSRLGDAQRNAGQVGAAIESYQRALNAPHLDSDLGTELSLARSYAVSGDHETALMRYEALQGKTPNDFTKASLDVLKGQSHFALGDNEAGFAAYRHAVENYPLSYDSYLALVALVEAGVPVSELDRGLVDYFANQYGVAIAAFDRYLASNPETGQGTALYYKGLSLRAVDNYQGALENWDTVISSYPADPFWDEAWEEKAFTQWAYIGDYPSAVITLLNFVATSPSHPRAAEFLFDAARISERNGDLQQAANLWEQVAVDYPAATEAYQALFLAGVSEYRIGGYEKSKETFQRTLGLAATDGEAAAVHFWIGKTEEILGDEIAARAAWERAATADPTGYYSERARDKLFGREPFEPPLGFDTAIDWEKERLAAEEWMRLSFALPDGTDLRNLGPLESDPRLLRGTLLWDLGLYSEARTEFEDLRQSTSSDPVASYRLANYLAEIGLYRSAIFAARQVLNLAGLDDAGTMIAPRYFNYLRFGTYFAELVNPAAQENGFHPLFIYSVMRQESLFEGFIRSSAGARGLMQIIPTTGQAIHNLIGWPPEYNADDLYRPKVSVIFGVDHLADLREIFDGNLYATLAGYNAGQGNASIWLAQANDDLDLYVEIVRFDETRRYIKGIYEIYSIYLRFYDRTF